MRNAFFTGGKNQGVWWLGFLVFIQATQVQFLGRELRSRFTPPLTAASPKSVPIDLLQAELPQTLNLLEKKKKQSLLSANGGMPVQCTFVYCLTFIVGICLFSGLQEARRRSCRPSGTHEGGAPALAARTAAMRGGGG